MGLRIVFFGTYILSDAYPVNQVLYAGVERAAGQVWSCRADLWDGFLHRALHAGWGRWFRLALRACRCYAKLIWRYMRCPEHEVVVVGYPGYIDILLARLLNLFSKRTLVLVSFISLYDTAVMDRQSVSPGSLKGRLLYAIDRCAFRSADWVLVDTQELGSHYANLFNIPRDKFRKSMVGNIFDRFPAASRQPVPSPSFRVLFFGTYVPLHGAECIVEAARALREERVEFTLIGQGQDHATVRERASGLEHVRFIETWLSAEELAEAMREADVCLGIFGTTPKAARVIPYKVFAALALGRPVITRDSPAIRELLVDGESALLCPAGDGQALAASIERLRTDVSLRERIGRNGYARYAATASAEAIGRDLVDQLEGAIGVGG